MLPAEISEKLSNDLKNALGREVLIHSEESIGGGCINNAVGITTSSGKFFLKYNLAGKYPEMFEKEALGLYLLSETGTIRIPRVIANSLAGNYSYLVLEFIYTGRPDRKSWESFGQSLAAMHRHTNPFFGLDYDNYIGSLLQSNRSHKTWIPFFIEERLEPLIRQACEHGTLSLSVARQFERLYLLLPGIIPDEPPALLHGDLWNGNYMIAEDGEACLIDPAVYYGQRETDIAMTKLFGGFPEEFYQGYSGAYPLESGWKSRIDIFNLYPLLVHVNLFGGGYARQVAEILNRLV
jgi:protein-ribulosamine 3-kinase